MAVGNKLVDRAKAALRMSSNNEAIVGEIKDILEAFKEDLRLVGVHRISEEDPLVIRAAVLYVKSQFGYMDKAEQYQKSYDMLKMSLALAGDYNEPITDEDFAVGKQVIVTGTIYPEPENEDKSITKAGAIMRVVELMDKQQYKHYIGVAAEKEEPPQGYAAPEILQIYK